MLGVLSCYCSVNNINNVTSTMGTTHVPVNIWMRSADQLGGWQRLVVTLDSDRCNLESLRFFIPVVCGSTNINKNFN